MMSKKNKANKVSYVKIIENSSFLYEYLNSNSLTYNLRLSNVELENRLEKWCHIVAKGDQKKFKKRLIWDSFSEESINKILGNITFNAKQEFPSWLRILRKACLIDFELDISQDNISDQYQYLDSARQLPFEDILIPFIEVAKKELKAKLGKKYTIITNNAQIQLERSLLKELVNISAFCFNFEFSVYKATHASSLFMFANKVGDSNSKQLYNSFINQILDDGIISFFEEYSVLAKLICVRIELWIENINNFALRLYSDESKIKKAFKIEVDLGKVDSIVRGISDSHNYGKSVMIVQFCSGLKLVYKPRDLGLEKAFFNFLKWFEQQKFELSSKNLKIVNCSTHGWIEFVEASACKNVVQISKYYQRAGMLLCIIYVLQGTDCHYENLIAHGEYPVLVDLETLLHPCIWSDTYSKEVSDSSKQKHTYSVCSTGLLPKLSVDSEQLESNLEYLPDYSGLGQINKNLPQQTLRWHKINTDNMSLNFESISLPPGKNNPFISEIEISPKDYVDDIVYGFQQTYLFITKNRKTLLSAKSPIKEFFNQKIRVVFRNSNTYSSISRKLLEPKYLRNGIERSLEMDILSRGLISSQKKHSFWSILKEEHCAMQRLDIPYFSAHANQKKLIVYPNITIENFFKSCSYDDIIDRINKLDIKNLESQVELIKSSF